MKLSLIAALSENKVIGKNQDLPWRLSQDLQYFKKTTMGCPIIMGRKNYESIGRALPGRLNIVITRNIQFEAPGCTVVSSLEQALELTKNEDNVFVIGGAQIYELALPLCQELHLTQVHAQVDGDVFFPEVSSENWNIQTVLEYNADPKNEFDFHVEHWLRN